MKHLSFNTDEKVTSLTFKNDNRSVFTLPLYSFYYWNVRRVNILVTF